MAEPITLHFMGAAGEVTGSKTVVRFEDQSFLVDYGMFQGEKTSKQKNWEPFGVNVRNLTAVVLTHAHMDHSGLLPKLVKEGFRGIIYCSSGTADLLKIMLADSARLQQEDADYANRTGHSRHKPALALYDEDDVRDTLQLVEVRELEKWYQLGEHVEFQFLRAGHITGSTFVRFRFVIDGKPTFVTFSGDIGHDRQHTVKKPATLPETDYLVLESTYGDRLHANEDSLEELAKVIHRAHQNKGVLVIPAFAVGRAQEIIYMIRTLEDQNRIPMVPIILDSPMSREATAVYLEHSEDFPEDATYGQNLRKFFPMKFEMIKSAQQSIELSERKGPMVIISASGMLEGGRVLHHLKNHLPSDKNTVLFVGYQAEGTKGRYLQEEAQKHGFMKIHHEEVKVKAKIEVLSALSGHGDRNDLIQWVQSAPSKPKKILLNHGSPHSLQSFAAKILEVTGIPCEPILEPKKIDLT
jgi:metallo-beta-lactamase family protein